MAEDKYEAAMQIILHAGNAKSAALMAIDAAAEGDFDEAARQLEESAREMTDAHHVQFGLTKAEASGSPVDLNIILVHAEDHLSMAIMANEFASRFIDMYKSCANIAA